jgi:hypothetical protein
MFIVVLSLNPMLVLMGRRARWYGFEDPSPGIGEGMIWLDLRAMGWGCDCSGGDATTRQNLEAGPNPYK